jgi:hypothetical protein
MKHHTSISVSERIADGVEEWSQLLELVNQRRDAAKLEGKDRYFLCGDKFDIHKN